SVGAMVKQTASLHTTYEIVEEKTQWLAPTPAHVQGGKPPMRICGRKADEMSQSRPKLAGRLRRASSSAVHCLLVTLLVFSHSGQLHAQLAQQPSPLTLQQAVNIAMEKNPERKAALADTKAASADVKEARSFLLPHATFSETATIGNDPV